MDTSYSLSFNYASSIVYNWIFLIFFLIHSWNNFILLVLLAKLHLSMQLEELLSGSLSTGSRCGVTLWYPYESSNQSWYLNSVSWNQKSNSFEVLWPSTWLNLKTWWICFTANTVLFVFHYCWNSNSGRYGGIWW